MAHSTYIWQIIIFFSWNYAEIVVGMDTMIQNNPKSKKSQITLENYSP